MNLIFLLLLCLLIIKYYFINNVFSSKLFRSYLNVLKTYKLISKSLPVDPRQLNRVSHQTIIFTMP